MSAVSKNIVILISGTGSNMAAIVRAAQKGDWEKRFGTRISAVLSNRPEAKGLAFAKEHHIETGVVDHRSFDSREAFDAEMMQAIDRHNPTLVLLAGFMRILTPGFVQHYEGRLINIHPSLLPAFPGLKTHQRAIESGCRFAGATVHRVTAELDHGEYLDQVVVPIVPGDTPEALSCRVLVQEHLMYPRVVERLLANLQQA